MSTLSEQFYTVGKIVNTHGLRGEVRILPSTDFAEERFAKGSTLYIFMPNETAGRAVTVSSSRLHKNVYITKFENYDHINDVERYKGGLLKVSEQQRSELDDGEYYYSDIIGCEVVTDEGEKLGVISEILAPGANDVWVVKPVADGEKSIGNSVGNSEEILIPYIDDVVLNIDVDAKKVIVHLLEGLR